MKKVLSILAGTLLSVSAFSQAFWTHTNYAGAFDATPTARWTDSWTNFTPHTTNYPAATVTLDTVITANRTLSSDTVYLLDDAFTYVDSTVTLTIEAGTIIRGQGRGALIFNRGSKIMAMGTETNPIVFTSNAPTGSRDYGDWAGVVICGAAKNNIATSPFALAEGGIGSVSLNRGLHGGNNDADNSGIMQYVRIEFPGQALGGNNSEINGLTLYSVGSGTVIDHIQVSYSGDDSFEWFGGAADAKYLVAFHGWDDDFDTDNGFRGRVQFGYIVRDSRYADQSGSNAFESDNDAQGSLRMPKTRAIFSNVTAIGPNWTGNTDSTNSKFQSGAHIRRNTSISIYNSIFTGHQLRGLYIDGRRTASNYCGDSIALCGNILVQEPAGKNFLLASNTDTLCLTNSAAFNTLAVADNNDTLASTALIMLGSTFGNSLTDYDARPMVGSPALTQSCWAWQTSGQWMGVEDEATVLGLVLYPNPAEGFTTLGFDAQDAGDLNISIIDLNGRVVRTMNNLQYESGKNTLQIDVQGLSTGIYVVNMNLNNTIRTQKLIIK